MNQTVVFGKLPNETDSEAEARIKAGLAKIEDANQRKAELLKKMGMA